MENIEQKLAALEALLFVCGEPIALEKVEKMLGVGGADAEELVRELKTRLADESRGFALVESGNRLQLVTKSVFGELLKTFLKEELREDLTPASLEVLSIVAYLGPISRSRIEYLRGVNSTFTLRNLLLRGLIERFQDSKMPLSYLYQPSFECLRTLGISSQGELPEHERFREILTRMEVKAEEQPEVGETAGEISVAPAETESASSSSS